VGLVLGAGGVIGGAWLTGGLQALANETGWDPMSADHIVGTSAGSMIGALLGVLMIEVLQQSLLRWAGISEFVKDAILGLLILIAVTADAIILGRLRDMWVRVRRRDRARLQAQASGGGAASGA